jgi:hypothetical protein
MKRHPCSRKAFSTTFFCKSDDVTSTKDTKKGDTPFESSSNKDTNAGKDTTTS